TTHTWRTGKADPDRRGRIARYRLDQSRNIRNERKAPIGGKTDWLELPGLQIRAYCAVRNRRQLDLIAYERQCRGGRAAVWHGGDRDSRALPKQREIKIDRFSGRAKVQFSRIGPCVCH